jgi:adenine phosphoribosyltransferase
METLKSVIRDIPDFPKEGIIFKDITPLLSNPVAFKQVIDTLRDRYKNNRVDQVVGVEARGFIFASALAYALGCGVVMVRKPGKLPYKTFQKKYSLEYGEDSVEIHQDALKKGQNVIIIDDVLATGGTLAACIELINKNFEVDLLEVGFLIELDFLKGRENLGKVSIYSMMHF